MIKTKLGLCLLMAAPSIEAYEEHVIMANDAGYCEQGEAYIPTFGDVKWVESEAGIEAIHHCIKVDVFDEYLKQMKPMPESTRLRVFRQGHTGRELDQ